MDEDELEIELLDELLLDKLEIDELDEEELDEDESYPISRKSMSLSPGPLHRVPELAL